MVKDIAKELGKQVSLKIDNKVKQLYFIKKFKGPIIHLIRNSIDHGIEDEYSRVSHGKKNKGEIKLSFYEEDGNYHIKISDDGRCSEGMFLMSHRYEG